MHLPPAASWNVGRAPWQRGVQASLGLLGAVAGLYFCFSQRWGVSSWLVLGALCASAASAAMSLFNRPAGQLRWDGERWHWSDADDYAVTRLACVLDLQRFLLLRIDCEQGRGLWLWLQSPSMDARWLALRRAVVASGQAMPRSQSASLPE
ncbi:hypothetical protein DIC66_18045 [Rhodoferax lacus]|uniref:Toxin CptA n=1 Tax=Rhodoferax lacus TaxID=2184758 RepID=A0A3E1R834_9BURK|nr:hypothetical protein [Rhodoferax lacus]RFO95526.1 hypothetical protein DIC66_18045 [Rhodoferax lacus]